MYRKCVGRNGWFSYGIDICDSWMPRAWLRRKIAPQARRAALRIRDGSPCAGCFYYAWYISIWLRRCFGLDFAANRLELMAA